MLRYHDREWGVPVHNDHKHFEFLVLEAAQGLSWSIVLTPNATDAAAHRRRSR
jgi:DNA-3-methyladenine glycosylase I